MPLIAASEYHQRTNFVLDLQDTLKLTHITSLAFAITCRKELHVYPWTPTPPSIYIAHKYFILESKAYSWLLSTLRKRSLSFAAGSKAMEGLRDNPLAKTSSASNKNYVQEVDISVFWDPNSFLDRLAPLNHSSNIWEDVFCLMGSCNEAQVTTIADYTRQTWPKTGHLVLTIFSEYIHERGNKTWTGTALHDSESLTTLIISRCCSWNLDSDTGLSPLASLRRHSSRCFDKHLRQRRR
jgi:hypothetical protein